MVGELTPALSAQREFRQTYEGLGRNGKEWRETCASKEQVYMGHTVQSSEAEIKGHEPVDPFLSKVFDQQKQANKQRRT
jgi:hypothetical protein